VSHPSWYKQDYNQNILQLSGKDSDLAALDFTKTDLRTAMIAEMKYWITNFDVDGFRNVNTTLVPVDFWNRATAELNLIKPLLFAADASSSSLHQYAFAAGYNPAVLNLANQAGKNKATKAGVLAAVSAAKTGFSSQSFGLNFLTNNEVNAATGSEVKRLGASAKAMAALIFTAPGMPLIYSGQEIGSTKQLKLYDFDSITWPTSNSTQDFYAKLVALKAKNPALASGITAGSVTVLKTSNKYVAAFSRRSGSNVVVTLINVSNKKARTSLTTGTDAGTFFDLATGKKIKLAKTASCRC